MNLPTHFNATVTLTPPSLVGITLAAILAMSSVITLTLIIALPRGFCSRRARWMREVGKTVKAAGTTLLDEIRGEEEYDEDENEGESGRRQSPPPLKT
jgi:hypothetical protein